jgi:hypothetical protein
MANYTISRIIRSEAGGSTTARNQTGVMTITPNPGYVVGDADFTHGSLPSGIHDVIFTTNGTAFTAGATVSATVTIASDFTMPSADTTIDIPINGNARRINAENVNNTSSLFLTPISATIGFADTTGLSVENVTLNSDQTGNVTVGTAGSGSSTVITIGGNIGTLEETDGSSIETENNNQGEDQSHGMNHVEIATFDLNAVGSDILDATDLPSFATSVTHLGINHQPADALSFTTKSVNENSNGEVTGVTISVTANPNKITEIPVDALTIEATGKSTPAQSTTPVIKNLKFGEGNISEFGETRKLQVFGDIGATFDLDVIETTISTGSTTSILDVDDAVIVKTGNLDSGESVYEKDVVIPEGSSSDKNYSVTITEKGSTVRGSALGDFHKGFPTRFTKKKADSNIFQIQFFRQTSPSPKYGAVGASALVARFDVAGAPISNLRASSLNASDTLSGNVVKVSRVLTTSDSSAFNYVSANLDITNQNLFITDGSDKGDGGEIGGSAYDSSKVAIVNLSGVLSGSSNEIFTLTFTLLFKSLGDSDFAYTINIPSFLTNT